MHHCERDQEYRREYRQPDEVEDATDAAIENDVGDHRETEHEGDRQPEVATDLRQRLGLMDLAEFLLERPIESQPGKATLELLGVRGFGGNARRQFAV